MPQGGQTLGKMSKIIEYGTANISKTIHVPSGSHIRIEGTLTRTANVPILAVDEYQGVDAKSTNIMIDGNGILDGGGYDADMIQLYNSVGNHYRDIHLKNFKGNGFYLNGQANANFKSFYNDFQGISFGELSGAQTANKAFFYVDQYAIDNFFFGCWGSAVGAASNQQDGFYVVGLAVAGGGGISALKCHFDHNRHFLNTDGNFKSGIRLNRCEIDTTIEDGVFLGNKTTGIIIDGCEWVNPPGTYDLIYLDTADYIEDLNVINNICRFGTHKYCMEATDNTKIHRSNVSGNSWIAGTSGDYLQIPANYSLVPP